MLAGRPDQHGDAAEQILGRQQVGGSASIVEAAFLLYWDVQRGEPEKGHATRSRAGNVCRSPVVVSQLLLTYDLPAMTPERIIGLLPGEFESWRRTAHAARLGRTGRGWPTAAPPPPPSR